MLFYLLSNYIQSKTLKYQNLFLRKTKTKRMQQGHIIKIISLNL